MELDLIDNIYRKTIAVYRKYTAYVDSLFTAAPIIADNISVCNQLNPQLFKGFNSSKNNLSIVLGHYKTIDVQINKIKSTVIWLVVNKKFTTMWCTESITDFYVCDYFLTKEGQYIDEEANVLEFKNACLAYFTEYNKIIDSEDTLHIHNTSVLYNFTQGLLKTIESLINLQETVETV